jgi:hypothetical protein
MRERRAGMEKWDKFMRALLAKNVCKEAA